MSERVIATTSGTGSMQPEERSGNWRYVLLTAAYNEQETIARTIESVLAQTRPPERWVIVSDGSVDATDDIVQAYARHYDFIRFMRITRNPGRSFGSKVIALRNAKDELNGLTFEFIGNLDADITLGCTYFEDLLQRFGRQPKLGLACGFVYENSASGFRSRRTNRTYSVAHAAQLVRTKCYEDIGGYAILEHGGEDWHAQTSARMNGWEAQAFPELPIFHHRRTGEADTPIRHRFRQGRMDYSFGSAPGFETLKCLDRMRDDPIIIGGLVRLFGYAWSWINREQKPVSDEFVAFIRDEQRGKIQSLFRRKRPSSRT